jgi:hypothetical protein
MANSQSTLAGSAAFRNGLAAKVIGKSGSYFCTEPYGTAAGMLTRKLAFTGFKRTISGVATVTPGRGESINGWMPVGPACVSGVAGQ